jgi:hypothetical protein
MARCHGWGALLCVLGIYAIVGVATADVLPRAATALEAANKAKNAAASCEYHAEKGVAEAASAADKADFAKAQDDCRKLKNEGAQAEYAIKKIIARAKAPPQQPDPIPDPAPTDPEPPAPDPQPDPVPSDPSPPVGDAITIDGVRLLPVSLGNITTPTGVWPVDSLGVVGDGKAYLFRYAPKKVWWSICITRAPDGSGSISERAYAVQLYDTSVRLTVLPGSMKCADNGDPVAPSMERLAAAVKAGRVLPYGQSAFAGWPTVPAFAPDKRPNGGDLTYRPDRIYGKSSASNAIGIVDGQGSEQPSSRGFISGDDAQAIAAAVAGNGAAFDKMVPVLRSGLLYGLSLPNFAIWSNANDMLRDPQIPLPGDEAYINEGQGRTNYGNDGKWCAPAGYPYLAEIGATAGVCYNHGDRNEAHLFNHGYAWWLATGDPRAALLLQATNAYMLASNYQRTAGAYNPRFAYQRATANQFNALWVLRDVSLNASGPLLWPKPRTDKMIADMWAGWEKKLAAMDAATDAFSRSSSAVRGIDRNEDNAYNTYQIHTYGLESAYLWARAGEPALMRRLAEHLIIRFGLIGGTRGYYGHGSGSGFAVLSGGKLPYDGTVRGLVEWSKTATQWPADSFDGAPAHYVLRAWWGLRMAAQAVPDAQVEGMTAAQALAVMDAARAKTTTWKDPKVIQWKHGAVPFE